MGQPRVAGQGEKQADVGGGNLFHHPPVKVRVRGVRSWLWTRGDTGVWVRVGSGGWKEGTRAQEKVASCLVKEVREMENTEGRCTPSSAVRDNSGTGCD